MASNVHSPDGFTALPFDGLMEPALRHNRSGQTTQTFSCCADDDRTSVRCSNEEMGDIILSPSALSPTTPGNTTTAPSSLKPSIYRFDSLRAVVVPSKLTGCLFGACSRPDLILSAPMASGAIHIDKEVMEQHTAVNAAHVSRPSRLPTGTWRRP